MRMLRGMRMLMAVRLRIMVVMMLRKLPTLQHMNLCAGDPTPIRPLNLHLNPKTKRSSSLSQNLKRDSRIDQSSKQHIAGDTSETFKIRNTHELSFLTNSTACLTLEYGSSNRSHRQHIIH